MILDARSEWLPLRACRDAPTEVFFPGRGESMKPAQAYCQGCPVTEQCLAESFLGPYGRFGVWGGRSERQRRKLRREWQRQGGLQILSRCPCGQPTVVTIHRQNRQGALCGACRSARSMPLEDLVL